MFAKVEDHQCNLRLLEATKNSFECQEIALDCRISRTQVTRVKRNFIDPLYESKKKSIARGMKTQFKIV